MMITMNCDHNELDCNQFVVVEITKLISFTKNFFFNKNN